MDRLRSVLESLGYAGSPLLPILDGDPSAGWRLVVAGERAEDAWIALRLVVDRTGHWPVLLGDDDELHYLAESAEDERRPVADILADAAAIDGEAWLDRRPDESIERLRQAGVDLSDLEFDEPRGNWPDEIQPSDTFTIPFDITNGSPRKSIHIGLVPTTRGWEVPAFLRFGNWNECPAPEHHVAIFRAWHNRHGAELFGLTHDTIECSVTRPPTDRDAALALARRQYIYCSDIVDQGVGTIDALAATLLGGSAWYFWWD